MAKLDGFLASLRELTAEQARLTAARQEVSQRIAEPMDKAQKLFAASALLRSSNFCKTMEYFW